jgi:hypothetical protein
MYTICKVFSMHVERVLARWRRQREEKGKRGWWEGKKEREKMGRRRVEGRKEGKGKNKGKGRKEGGERKKKERKEKGRGEEGLLRNF